MHITPNKVIYFWSTKWRAINGKHVKNCRKMILFNLDIKIPRRQRRKSSNQKPFIVTNVQYVNLNIMIQCQPNLKNLFFWQIEKKYLLMLKPSKFRRCSYQFSDIENHKIFTKLCFEKMNSSDQIWIVSQVFITKQHFEVLR